MTKEGKTVNIASLTILFFAIYQFIISGSLIFPFPLNEFIFLIVALSFIPIYSKTNPYTVLLTVLLGVLNILHSEFFWSMLLGAKDMQYLSESLWTDFFKLFYYIGLITWMIFTAQENKSIKIKIGVIIPITILIIGAWKGNLLIEFSSIIILFVYSLSQIKTQRLNYLWILLFILELTKVWSLGSFGVK